MQLYGRYDLIATLYIWGMIAAWGALFGIVWLIK